MKPPIIPLDRGGGARLDIRGGWKEERGLETGVAAHDLFSSDIAWWRGGRGNLRRTFGYDVQRTE